MKKIVLLLIILICFVGCTNDQSSSLEEAKYVASQQPDFGSFIQAISVSSGKSIGLVIVVMDPFLWQTDPRMKYEGNSSTFVHLIIYEATPNLNTPPVTIAGNIQKTAYKKYYLLILDDSRPPKIVAKKELFSATVLIDE